MKQHGCIFKFLVIAAIIFILAVFVYNVFPQRIANGDPAMTTLMYFSTFQPQVLERDPIYNIPVQIYPRAFLLLRGFFWDLAGGDVLLSVKLLFGAELLLQVLFFGFFLFLVSRDKWLSALFAAAMTGFVFLPSSMTWGFFDLYQVTNRQVFWIFFPAVFYFYVKNFDTPRRLWTFFYWAFWETPIRERQ